MKFVAKHRLKSLLLILIAAYFVLRLPNLTLQPIFADEAIYIRWAQVMRSEPTLRFLPQSDGKTPLFMWLMIPFFKVFKDPLFAGRFLSVISGFFTFLGVFFLSKKVFNFKVALWASLFYVITPYVVFFDRMALVDSMLSAFAIWVIYFALWLVQNPRLDLAMILGYLMGGAILTKTPGLINLLLLPFSAISFKRQSKNSFVRLVVWWAVAIGIAIVMYNLLRLGPEFQKLSQRNTDYVFSPLELVGRPLDPFIPHFNDIKDWFPKLFTTPILLFIALGIFYSFGRRVSFGKRVSFGNKQALVILVWLLIPMLISMAFLKTFTARYLLTSVAPMLIFASYGLTQLLEKFKLSNFRRTIIGLTAVLPLALYFNYQLITNPPPENLPKAERRGYFEDWTAGYGLKEIGQYLAEENRKTPIVIGTEGFFGTLPDGLYIYLDKANVAIVGSTATISAQLKESARQKPTFFVGNRGNLKGGIGNAKIILEYPKAKPDDKEVDATVLYQILPE